MIDFDLMYRILPKPHDKVLSVYHLNQIIINSIEYSRCAERKSVWPNFSNFNTDCHSGSSSKLSQSDNVYKQ